MSKAKDILKFELKTELRPGEEIIKEGGANLMKFAEGVGGYLVLTNQRLIFESHKFNIQRGITIIELSDIQSARPCWIKVLIPIVPTGILVLTKDNKEYRFVVTLARESWAEAIEEQLHQAAQ